MKLLSKNRFGRDAFHPRPHPSEEQFGTRWNASLPSSRGQQGVALVVTIILISVITFLTIAFLALSWREKGAVAVSTDQLTAKLAAQAGFERAQAEMMSTILATTNPFNFDLLVSTNFINRSGYVSGVNDPTNVNYEAAAALNNPTELQRNIANLLYNPRPPVFITNRAFANSNEFRFDVDLNRNGLHDPSGLWPVISPNFTYYDTNGFEVGDARQPPPANVVILSNFFVGDPQWIGILERPDRPHSGNNIFLSRYSYFVVPAGKTLDVNYIHNQANNPQKGAMDLLGRDFLRNQGVGSWEINLASFLYDLNTNLYAWGGLYFYDPLTGFQPNGNAFADAGQIYRYRVAGPQPNSAYAGALWPVSDPRLFPARAVSAFNRDWYDGYSAGPIMTNTWGWNVNVDADVTRTTLPWPGAENANHYFTAQDFFDGSKLPTNFVNRLLAASTNVSSYDRYTYYRMMAQLGTDSAPEPDGKINLNYFNAGGVRATNFVGWDDPDIVTGNAAKKLPAFNRRGSEVFFNAAVSNLLRAAGYNPAAGIPVLVGTNFAYTASLHRWAQVAANIWDATTNRLYDARPDSGLPTVFRPQFERRANNDIYITNFVEVLNVNDIAGLTLRDLSNTNVAASVRPNDLIFGVPLVVSARKGLPNFNEFAMESVVQITREVELVKSAPGGANRISQTNQMFTIGISNVIGAEFWNSYAANYTRPVEIYVTNYLSMSLTNEYGPVLGLPAVMKYGNPMTWVPSARMQIPNGPTNVWPGWDGSAVSSRSFLVPLSSNLVHLADAAYQQTANQFVPRGQAVRNANGDFRFPRWGLTITNRLQAIVVDTATKRIVDYIHLNGLTAHRDLSREIAQERGGLYYAGLWATNAIGNFLSDQPGIVQQIIVSLGYGDPGSDWRDYGIGQASGSTRAKAIANFMAFFTSSHQASYGGFIATNDSLAAFTPFTPSRKISVPISWQANDPLVHYTSGDLLYVEKAHVPQVWNLRMLTNHAVVENIGKRNNRYQPWAQTETDSDPNAVNIAVKDPGITRSDKWQFPTNKFPNIGWLGRVHRGTPWQTVYLKSAPVSDETWRKWTGNQNLVEARGNLPVTDRAILDVFTTAFNDNAVRGQLPINQTNLAAWSALFSGIIVLEGDTNRVSKSVPGSRFAPYPIEPVGASPFDPVTGNPVPLQRLVNAINDVRATNFAGGVFARLGDILAVPELSDRSPFLNLPAVNATWGLNDTVYEWLPQQMLSLVRLGEPRFVVYAFGQTLRRAPNSVVTSGPFPGICTNYQVTAEVAVRAVVRIEGAPNNSHAVVESYNTLPPD